MGVIENIQDYFVKNSQEYKGFINEMKNSSPELFFMDGERKFSNKEQNFLRIYDKEKVRVIPVTQNEIQEYYSKIHELDSNAFVALFPKEQLNSIPDYIEGIFLDKIDKVNLLINNYPVLYDEGKDFTFIVDNNGYLKKHTMRDENLPEGRSIQEFLKIENVFFKEIQLDVVEAEMKNFRPTYLEEKNKVEIIPATEEQKLQYSQHIDGKEFNDMPIVDFPEFSKTQLNSVPDIIDGIPVTEYEKKMILLDSFEFSASNNWSSTFSIDENNKLIEKYHDVDSNNEVFEIKKHISKEDVMYVHQNDKELKNENKEMVTTLPIVKEKLESLAEKLNNYYDQIAESMWNFNHKEGKEILEFVMNLKEYPDNVKNMVLDYLILDPPVKPDFHDYTDNIYDGERLFDEAIEKYISKELPDYNYKIKNLSETLIKNGIDTESIPPIKYFEINSLNILLNDVTNKDFQKEKVKLDTPKHVQLSTESNLSIDNIYGFSPTVQQKEDLKNGKGITGEIKGKNYFIMLSAQEKNKGSLQILSMEKAKELNLISEKNQIQKNIKQTGLRV